MTSNKTVVATMVAAVALILLIAWGFYQTLQLGSGKKIKLADYPQKAIMAQAQAVNEARLDELAQRGKVTPGMNEKQVCAAFGEPVRTERMEQHGEQQTIWWYEHEGWMCVVFNSDGLVDMIKKQP